jgi:hypothetical protein
MLPRLLLSRGTVAVAHAKAALAVTAVVTTVSVVPLRHMLSDGSTSTAHRSKPLAEVAPPRPLLTSTPTSPTRATNASFRYTDAERGVTFACRLERTPAAAGAYSRCGTPTTYTSVALGAHTFCVEAGDARGAVSARACSTWTIVATSTAAAAFTINGTGRGVLSPGGPAVPVDLQLHNPGSTALTVLSVTTRVTGTSVSACAADNFVVVEQLTATPTVPAEATATLSGLGVPVSSWPELRMVASGDQQACQRATVYLAFSSADTGATG